ncbi:MAG: EAL domain-containing protein, partial [Oscillospiraceae bacterium]
HELSQKDKAVISTIISLAHSLNLYVVSEGIENKIQVDFLNESGCDVVQGFFFYKPMERESFEELISKQ